MLKSLVFILLSTALAIPQVSAHGSSGGSNAPQRCGKGEYNKLRGGKYYKEKCPDGYYQDDDKHFGTFCKEVQPGFKGNKDRGADCQEKCGPGKYSIGKTSSCSNCPPGHQCPGETNPSPEQCPPGTFQKNSGSRKRCEPCPKGEFSNIWGATSCCECCRGFFNEKTGQTSCDKCPSQKPGGPSGSKDKDNCSTFGGNKSPDTCEQKDRKCPNPECNPGPSPKPNNPHRRDVHNRCARGYKRCALLHGRGGFDCVDIANDVESCGGCIDFTNSEGSGKDCTAIEGANDVQCVKGQCAVRSCKRGYVLNASGGCDPALVI
ncbi:Dihydroxyacetone synthase [Tulasnella sp. 418]|nr:Dihydroxyacetone synthase [Tulasnella sp. 418]